MKEIKLAPYKLSLSHIGVEFFISLPSSDLKYDSFSIVYGYVMKQWFALYMSAYIILNSFANARRNKKRCSLGIQNMRRSVSV